MSTTSSQSLSSALTVISANIEGLSAIKASMLSDLCKEQHCHCLCLQETHRGERKARPRIPGMTLVASYLCDLIVPYVNTRSLRSNDKCLIKPCKSRLRSYGKRCFKYAGPQEWNKLSIYIRKSSSISILKTQLKTYLFRLAYPSS